MRRTSPGTRPNPVLRRTSPIRDGSEGREAYRRKRTYSQMKREDTRFGDSRNMERRSEVSDKRSEVSARSVVSERRSEVSEKRSEVSDRSVVSERRSEVSEKRSEVNDRRDIARRDRHTDKRHVVRYKGDRRCNEVKTSHTSRASRNTHNQSEAKILTSQSEHSNQQPEGHGSEGQRSEGQGSDSEPEGEGCAEDYTHEEEDREDSGNTELSNKQGKKFVILWIY